MKREIIMTMVDRLKQMFKKEYIIEYNMYKQIIIRNPIKVEDLIFIRNYFNMYNIIYTNIIVDTWKRR